MSSPTSGQTLGVPGRPKVHFSRKIFGSEYHDYGIEWCRTTGEWILPRVESPGKNKPQITWVVRLIGFPSLPSIRIKNIVRLSRRGMSSRSASDSRRWYHLSVEGEARLSYVGALRPPRVGISCGDAVQREVPG